MKPFSVLLDTGPLVAFLNKDDAWHERCVAEMVRLQVPLLTCWPVLTEAHWLLRQHARRVERMFDVFCSGLCTLARLDESALPWLDAFLRRYRNLGAQLADAALVYLAEREGISTVFTLDQRDFHVYRYSKNRKLNIIPSVET